MTRILWLLFLIAVGFNDIYASREIVFIGINGNGSPSAYKTFENRLRDHLSSNIKLHLADRMESKRYQNLTDFSTSSSLSTEKLNNLKNFVPVSSLIMWVNIKGYSINPERKYLFWSSLEGRLIIGLNIYHPNREEFVYCGDIEVVTSRSEGPVLFRPVSKTVHISAIDRAEIMEDLEYKAVRDCNRIIISVVQNENSRDGESSRDTVRLNSTNIEPEKLNSSQNIGTGDSSVSDKVTKNGIESSENGKKEEKTGQ